jgi:hypothetical protein
MQTLLIATRNAHKTREIGQMLGSGCRVSDLLSFSFARPFAGLEKPSQDNAEYINGEITFWPSRATMSRVHSALW